MADVGMSYQMLLDLWPIVIGIASILLGTMGLVWRQSRKAALLDIDIKGLKKSCLKIDEMDHRLTVIETRFEPFLVVLEEALGKMFPNPIDMTLVEKIGYGGATIEEIDAESARLAGMIHEKTPDTFKIVIEMYWLAMRKADLVKAMKK